MEEILEKTKWQSQASDGAFREDRMMVIGK